MLNAGLRPSWILAALLTAAHGAAIAIIVVVDMPPWLKLVAMAALALNFLFDIRRTALLLMPESVTAIEIAADDTLSIQTRRGEWIECEVLGNTYVVSFLTVLNLRERENGAVRRVVILPDSMEREDFRRLRVWLRWKAHDAKADGA